MKQKLQKVYIQVAWDSIQMEPYTFEQWKQVYKSKIRVGWKVDALENVRCGLIRAEKTTKLYAPWYDNGNWMDGKPRRLSLGDKNTVVRLPALRVDGKYLILDGNHRINELRPNTVFLDYLDLAKKDLKYFVDLHNPFWKMPR